MKTQEEAFPVKPVLGVCFVCFLATAVLCSYFPFGLETKLWIFILGFLLPFLLLTQKGSECFVAGIGKEEFLPQTSLIWVLVFTVLAMGLRFWKLTSYSGWPIGDESNNLFIATDLLRHWQWKMFFGFAQHPFPFIWLLALGRKIFSDTGWALWFFPALFSCAAVGMAYAAARTAFSRSFAWVFTGLVAFSFWPLFAGRIAVHGTLQPFFEFLGFFTLGLYLREQRRGALKIAKALALGASLGAGFYIFPSWAAFLVWVSVGWLASAFQKKSWECVWIAVGALATASPFLGAVSHQDFGTHIQKLWAFSGEGGFSPAVAVSYVSALFVGPWVKDLSNGPVFGGALNPLLDAFFAVGLAWAAVHWRERAVQWTALGSVLLLLPGVLSANLEMYRVLLILPVLLAGVAAGVEVVLKALPSGTKPVFLTVCLALSLGVDLYHLMGPARDSLSASAQPLTKLKDYERLQAFKILQEQDKQSGSGGIWTELGTEDADLSLSVMTYPFNAVWYGDVDAPSVTWAAFLTDANFYPFLSKRFPQAQWYDLAPPQLGSKDLLLAVMPLGPKNLMVEWNGANEFATEVNREEVNLPNGVSRHGLLQQMLASPLRDSKDPFLLTCYWEKVVYVASWEEAFYPSDPLISNRLFETAFQEMLSHGYSAASVYYKWGLILEALGRNAQARQAFEKAVHCPVNETPAVLELKQMGGN